MACLLCGGLISVSGGDRARFVDHMSNEHDAKTDCHDLLLAACVLDPREKLFLVKSTATRLDTIGKGRAPNFSDNFVDKMTHNSSSSAPASKPAHNPPPASLAHRTEDTEQDCDSETTEPEPTRRQTIFLDLYI